MAFKQNPHQYSQKQIQNTLDTVKRVSTVKKENKKESIRNKAAAIGSAIAVAGYGMLLNKSMKE